MEIVRGNIGGDLTVEVDTELRANVMGDVVVRPGRRLVLRGNVLGDLVLEGDATADVGGNLAGTIRRVDGAA